MEQMNRLQTTYSAMVLLAALLVTGCSSEDTTGNDSHAVSFVTGVMQASTRATTSRDNMWNLTDRIAISDGTEVKKYKPSEAGASVALTKDDSETLPFYWSIGKGDMTFTAWSPYTEKNESLPVTVAIDQRATASDEIADVGTLADADFSAYDLLYAPEKTATSGTTVPLQFYHQMARIVVYVIGVATNEYDDENGQHIITNDEIEEVTRVELGKDNICCEATLTRRGITGVNSTAANGVQWAVGRGTASVVMRDADPQTGLGVDGAKKRRIFECLIPPQRGGIDPVYDGEEKKQNGSPLLTFYTTRRTENPYKYESSFDYKAGYQYVYYIGLSRAGLYVAYTVEDWGAVTETGARSQFNYMDHPGATITDWTEPSGTITGDLGKF